LLKGLQSEIETVDGIEGTSSNLISRPTDSLSSCLSVISYDAIVRVPTLTDTSSCPSASGYAVQSDTQAPEPIDIYVTALQ